jgi:hypothetical protein
MNTSARRARSVTRRYVSGVTTRRIGSKARE